MDTLNYYFGYLLHGLFLEIVFLQILMLSEVFLGGWFEDLGFNWSFVVEIFGIGIADEVIPAIISSLSSTLSTAFVCIMLLRQAVNGVSGAAISSDFLDLSECQERNVPAFELSLYKEQE